MSKPMIRIHDTETNEIIDRQMTDEEFAQYEIEVADYLAKETAKAEQAAAKQAALDKLGLTAEELAAALA